MRFAANPAPPLHPPPPPPPPSALTSQVFKANKPWQCYTSEARTTHPPGLPRLPRALSSLSFVSLSFFLLILSFSRGLILLRLLLFFFLLLSLFRLCLRLSPRVCLRARFSSLPLSSLSSPLPLPSLPFPSPLAISSSSPLRLTFLLLLSSSPFISPFSPHHCLFPPSSPLPPPSSSPLSPPSCLSPSPHPCLFPPSSPLPRLSPRSVPSPLSNFVLLILTFILLYPSASLFHIPSFLPSSPSH